MTKIELINRLTEAQTYFGKSKYRPIVLQAAGEFGCGMLKECEQWLNKLPTPDQLMTSLVQKLKGKRIHETITKIVNKEVKESDTLVAKGLSSLLTHVIIESETIPEYLRLIPIVNEQLTETLYALISK